MKTPAFWKKPLYSALVFFGTLIVLSVGYAAWNAAMSKVTAGNPLTAVGWNALVDNIADLDSRWARSGSNLAFTGGSVGIGTASPGTTLDVNGSITNRNSVGGNAQRTVKVQGASGTFTHLRVTVYLRGGAGSWLYRIQTASAWPVASQAGGGYTNGTANFSHVATEGAGFTVTSPSNEVIQFDYNGGGTHPVCIFEIVGSLNQNFTDADITITYS